MSDPEIKQQAHDREDPEAELPTKAWRFIVLSSALIIRKRLVCCVLFMTSEKAQKSMKFRPVLIVGAKMPLNLERFKN